MNTPADRWRSAASRLRPQSKLGSLPLLITANAGLRGQFLWLETLEALRHQKRRSLESGSGEDESEWKNTREFELFLRTVALEQDVARLRAVIAKLNVGSAEITNDFSEQPALKNSSKRKSILEAYLRVDSPLADTENKVLEAMAVAKSQGKRRVNDQELRLHVMSLPSKYARRTAPQDIVQHMSALEDARSSSFAVGVAVDSEPGAEPFIIVIKLAVAVHQSGDRVLRTIAMSCGVFPVDITLVETFTTADEYSLVLFTLEAHGPCDITHLHTTVKLALEERSKVTAECGATMEAIWEGTVPPWWRNWEDDANIGVAVGDGASGVVYDAQWHGAQVAIKKLKHLEGGYDDAILSSFIKEIKILSKLRHPHVVLFIGAYGSKTKLYIVTEFLSGGTLYSLLRKRKLRIDEILYFAKHIASAMHYLHDSGIIHRDLKSPNLMIDKSGDIKVVDLGLGCIKDENVAMTDDSGTYRWAAPELLLSQSWDEKIDVFSYGIVLWELVHQALPYAELDPIQVAVGVVGGTLRPTIDITLCPPSLAQLMQQCWAQDAADRPSFGTVIKTLDAIITEQEAAATKDASSKTTKPPLILEPANWMASVAEQFRSKFSAPFLQKAGPITSVLISP